MFTPILPFGGFLWLFRVVARRSRSSPTPGRRSTCGAKAHGARTTRYVAKEAARATVKSKMMRWGGVALLLFLVWHLLQFTIVKFNVGPLDAAGSPGLLVISSFQVWWVVLIYLLALVALGPAPLPRRLERHPDAGLGRQRRRAPARQDHRHW